MTDEPDRSDKSLPGERDAADSDCVRWVAEFAADLRRMHEKAGKPSSRQMSMKVRYSHTALSNALRGLGGRLPSLKLTLALVRVCGGDEQAWQARWYQEQARIAAHTTSRDRGLGAGQAVPTEFDVRTPPRRPRGRILLPALGVALALVAGGVFFAFNHGVASAPPAYGFGGALPSALPPCAPTGTYNPCEIQRQMDRVPRDDTPQQMKERIATFSQDSPQRPGPWPFFVYDTIVAPEDLKYYKKLGPKDLGHDVKLEVWTTPGTLKDGPMQLIGFTDLGFVLWADCYVHGYPKNVPPGDDAGDKWLRIPWPTNPPNTPLTLPSPTDPSVGYVYAGYALPFTHNGKIPACT
ncbi:MAG: hypothetical protein ACRDR6_17170 [Pseudonocardiaceae bacterium]